MRTIFFIFITAAFCLPCKKDETKAGKTVYRYKMLQKNKKGRYFGMKKLLYVWDNAISLVLPPYQLCK